MEEARREEARRLAARLRAMVEGQEVCFTRASSDRAGQFLGYGDIVLLFRSTSSMRIYERELADSQIPYLVQKGRGFFQTQEVRDLINLIQVLDNPRDDFRLAAVLRSPLCGLSDDDLFRLARCEGEPGRRRLYDKLKLRRGIQDMDKNRATVGAVSQKAISPVFHHFRYLTEPAGKPTDKHFSPTTRRVFRLGRFAFDLATRLTVDPVFL